MPVKHASAEPGRPRPTTGHEQDLQHCHRGTAGPGEHCTLGVVSSANPGYPSTSGAHGVWQPALTLQRQGAGRSGLSVRVWVFVCECSVCVCVVGGGLVVHLWRARVWASPRSRALFKLTDRQFESEFEFQPPGKPPSGQAHQT